MAPNTTTTSIETVSEQFQKLDLKALAKEKGSYQVFPKIHVRFIILKHDDILLNRCSILLLKLLNIMILESLVIPRRHLCLKMLKRPLI